MTTADTPPILLLGSPVKHSISPAMQNRALRLCHVEHVYEKREVTEEGFLQVLEDMRKGYIKGANVTLPHKRLAAQSMDELSPEAQRSGSVNTIEVLPSGRLKGHDTDGLGFLQSLTDSVPGSANQGALWLYGAGGAARAVAQTLLDDRGLSPHFLVRSPVTAREQLSSQFDDLLVSPLGSTNGPASGLHIHCTPVGLGALKGSVPWTEATQAIKHWLPDDMTSSIAVDLIYTPEETPFLALARERGAKTVSGLGMLVHQGALAFTIWTGQKAPVNDMWQAARDALHAR